MKVLIFGGTGSLGRKLIERWLPNHDVAVFSRDEAKHWVIKNELSSTINSNLKGNLRFFVGDIRDRSRISDVLRQYEPDTVVIAAALKQVDTCELSPSESIMTNMIGTQNVVDAVNMTSFIKKVLFVSTDKACSPVNVYGMCKAVSERVVTSQAMSGKEDIKFLAVRYGNVLESRGSIIPLFKFQGLYAEKLTVTDPDMTRFLMTLDNSVDLIDITLEFGKSGETWIPKLPAMRVGDLADIFSKIYDKKILFTGRRPGEKMYEDLINSSEGYRTRSEIKNKKSHYVIDPSFNASCLNSVNQQGTFTYTSADDVMTRDELEQYLTKLNILNVPPSTFTDPQIKQIVTNVTSS